MYTFLEGIGIFILKLIDIEEFNYYYDYSMKEKLKF